MRIREREKHINENDDADDARARCQNCVFCALVTFNSCVAWPTQNNDSFSPFPPSRSLSSGFLVRQQRTIHNKKCERELEMNANGKHHYHYHILAMKQLYFLVSEIVVFACFAANGHTVYT